MPTTRAADHWDAKTSKGPPVQRLVHPRAPVHSSASAYFVKKKRCWWTSQLRIITEPPGRRGEKTHRLNILLIQIQGGHGKVLPSWLWHFNEKSTRVCIYRRLQVSRAGIGILFYFLYGFHLLSCGTSQDVLRGILNEVRRRCSCVVIKSQLLLHDWSFPRYHAVIGAWKWTILCDLGFQRGRIKADISWLKPPRFRIQTLATQSWIPSDLTWSRNCASNTNTPSSAVEGAHAGTTCVFLISIFKQTPVDFGNWTLCA